MYGYNIKIIQGVFGFLKVTPFVVIVNNIVFGVLCVFIASRFRSNENSFSISKKAPFDFF